MISRLLKISFSLITAVFIYTSAEACTNVLVSKGASADGSIMITYAADSHALYGEVYFHPAGMFPKDAMLDVVNWDNGKYIGQISQIRNTYQTVGNMNEHQVMITETTYGGRSELEDPDGGIDYGGLIYITLQRAKTAREAIQIIADLANEYGYASEGESFSVGDKNEAWIMELIGKGSNKNRKGINTRKGIVWAAAKVPDGYICAHANQARINHIDFSDKNHENWMWAEDVVDFAREMKYFKGKDEDFSFCDSYAPLTFGGARGCEARVWSAFNILGEGVIGGKDANEYLDYAMGYNLKNKMPLFTKPAQKVTLKALSNVMRDHYEGTPMDMTKDVGAGGHQCPYRWRPMGFKVDGNTYVQERAIATQQTGFWILCQARNWLPDEIGGILWFGVDDAATSALTPIYTSCTRTPVCLREGNGNMVTYSPTSLFWLSNRIAQFAYLMYNRVQPVVRAHADAHELKCIEEVKDIDANALKMYKVGEEPNMELRRYLTNYSCKAANELFQDWSNLNNFLLVKFMDGNIKYQNEDGSFTTNGNTNVIPKFPAQPGYTKEWYERIAKDHGKTLMVPTSDKN
ncbi:MAG: C69 family dipeptidase [Bacteroidales bacterium]